MAHVMTCRVCKCRNAVPAALLGRLARCDLCMFSTRVPEDAPAITLKVRRRRDTPMRLAVAAVAIGAALLGVAAGGLLL